MEKMNGNTGDTPTPEEYREALAKLSLGEKQRVFPRMVANLINFAYDQGFELSFGDAYRSPLVTYGHKDSLHRSRLAIDLNLFRNGTYLTKTEHHQVLGVFWESMGGTWGGRFGDGNHYSIAHGGMK